MRCENKADKYVCALAKVPEYDQLGALALELLCISPDTVECERAFSHMNLTKTNHPGKLASKNVCLHGQQNT